MTVLYVTTVAGTMNFFPDHIKLLLSQGNKVELACNCDVSNLPEYCSDLNLKVHNIHFARNPISGDNVLAYKELKKLLQSGIYDVVHTHTPTASFISRLVCHRLKNKKIRVIYTAHGFHFYKGAPLKNWLLYYPVEKICSRFTDTLITINHEDYELANKKFHMKHLLYIPGIGIDTSSFDDNKYSVSSKRAEINIPENMVWFHTTGELIKRKNHENLIRAVSDFSNVYLTIAGEGGLNDYLQDLIEKLDLSNRVKLLGYRNDISELCSTSDVYVQPAIQEGLPVAVMEAMSCKRPIICSRIRGNVDLLNESGAEFFDPNDISDLKFAIKRILKRNWSNMGDVNRSRIENFSKEVVLDKMKQVYFD